MPGELDELYKETLARIQKQSRSNRELGMRILGWITHTKRPLSVDELRYGLAVEYSDVPGYLEEFDEDNLLPPWSLVDVCEGLVIIDSNSQVVRLVHYTTQQYLDKARMQLFKGAQVEISRDCLTYLSCIDTEVRDKTIEDKLIESRPFLDYACRHWFSHAKNILMSEDADPSLLEALARFKSSGSITFGLHLLWLLSHRPYMGLLGVSDRKGDAYPYEVASHFGLEDLVHVLLDRRTGPYPNLNSSLVIASLKGHLNVARLLLQNGAAIDALLISKAGEPVSALIGACIGGHLAVAEFLIENGADIHGRNSASLSPIHAAAMYDNPNIIDLLLKKGVDVNSRNSRGATACHLAVMCGWIKSTRRLIDAGCDLELKDDHGDTVLLACSIDYSPNGNRKPIELLLDRGVDACAKNKNGKTLRNMIENQLELEDSERKQRSLEGIVERLRQLEQKSSTTATNDAQTSEPTSSAQTVSSVSTS